LIQFLQQIHFNRNKIDYSICRLKEVWKLSITFYGSYLNLFGVFFFLALLGFELRVYTLSHSTSPLLWWVFSRWVWWTICLGWLGTVILLISASWVARHELQVPGLLES
jgi:hypothetical protein